MPLSVGRMMGLGRVFALFLLAPLIPGGRLDFVVAEVAVFAELVG